LARKLLQLTGKEGGLVVRKTKKGNVREMI